MMYSPSKQFLLFVLSLLFIFSLTIKQAFPLTPQQEVFIYRENHMNSWINPQNRRDSSGNHFVGIEESLKYFKIPLDKISEYSDPLSLNPKLREALVFKEKGREYLRWFIHPEDRKYYKDTLLLLKALKLKDEELHLYNSDLKGYLTASRSILILPKSNSFVFSAKVSTNYVGGREEYESEPKIVKGEEAEGNIIANQYIVKNTPKEGLEHLIILKEPLAYTIEGFYNPYTNMGLPSQGMIVRDLGDLGGVSASSPHDYLPVFSLTQDKETRPLREPVALSLNKDYPEDVSNKELGEFWRHNFAGPMGKALAEYLAYYGLNMTSLHGQQFLIQTDEQGIPTKKIVMRDFTDSELMVHLICAENENAKEVLKATQIFPRFDKNTKSHDFYLGFPVGRMTDVPSWLSSEEYSLWVKEYYKAFDETFSKLTGVPLVEQEVCPLYLIQDDDPKISQLPALVKRGDKGNEYELHILQGKDLLIIKKNINLTASKFFSKGALFFAKEKNIPTLLSSKQCDYISRKFSNIPLKREIYLTLLDALPPQGDYDKKQEPSIYKKYFIQNWIPYLRNFHCKRGKLTTCNGISCEEKTSDFLTPIKKILISEFSESKKETLLSLKKEAGYIDNILFLTKLFRYQYKDPHNPLYLKINKEWQLEFLKTSPSPLVLLRDITLTHLIELIEYLYEKDLESNKELLNLLGTKYSKLLNQ